MKLKIDINKDIVDLIESPVGVRVNMGDGVGIDVASGGIKIGINKRPPVQIELKARRTLDGHILIFDHRSIDLVIMPEKNKCLAFAKEVLHEDVYGAQDRLAKFLIKKGVVDPSLIKGGNVFGSMEYPIRESKIPGIDNIQATLYTIYRYLLDERRHSDAGEEYEEDTRTHLLEPDTEFSTELGQIPQKDVKGSIDSRIRPFGYQYKYSLVRESESKE